MSNYRRCYIKGGCYFFTLVTYNRNPILCTPPVIARLKDAFRYAIKTRPFLIEGLVVLPDHLHCILRLPEHDDDFSIRWRMIKHYLSLGIDAPINHRREKLIWQRRFWEHCIRDEKDFWRCMDYIHYNPVKHGHVDKPYDWPYSSFRKNVAKGHYAVNWGDNREPENIVTLDWD